MKSEPLRRSKQNNYRTYAKRLQPATRITRLHIEVDIVVAPTWDGRKAVGAQWENGYAELHGYQPGKAA